MTSLPSNVKIFAEQPEDGTIAMLKELAKLPFVNQPIRVMPDCHSGKGTIIKDSPRLTIPVLFLAS